MCIFANPVEDVRDTNIAVLLGPDDKRFTVYQMSVELLSRNRGNAMILPVPTSQPIQLVDMSRAKDFFSNLDYYFQERSRGLTDCAMYSSPLIVVRVGSYDVSIAPDVDSIDRIDPRVFTLSPSTKKILQTCYASGYQFVVATLTSNGEHHPLGYIYTASNPDEVFFPTKHLHGEVPHSKEVFDHKVFFSGVDSWEKTPDPDANMKTVGVPELSVYTRMTQPVPEIEPFLPPMYIEYRWQGQLHKFTRIIWEGLLPNVDAVAKVKPCSRFSPVP